MRPMSASPSRPIVAPKKLIDVALRRSRACWTSRMRFASSHIALYTICERKGWAEEARAYNELVASWPAVVEASQKTPCPEAQGVLLGVV